ncbi:MAG: hypothetical protein FWE05_11280 [Defluviitaleaceae bacterium]|nr:hypothetical protein [Defluviitaleaceae bacterium]
MKKIVGMLLVFFIAFSNASFINVLAATPEALAVAPPGWTTIRPSGSVVSVWGTPANAIRSGPVWGSQLFFQVSPTPNTNNRPFTIPSVNSLFTLEPGWVIDYVHDGSRRQPGQTTLLFSSGTTLVYYFRQAAPPTHNLIVQTAVNNTVMNTVNRGNFTANQLVSISPNTTGFNTADYQYVFTGWTRISGSGTFANANSQTTNFTTGSSATIVRANFTKTPIERTHELIIQTAVNGVVVDAQNAGSYDPNTLVPISPNRNILNTSNYIYEFLGWTLTTGNGTILFPNLEDSFYFTGASNAVVTAHYTRVPMDSNNNGNDGDDDGYDDGDDDGYDDGGDDGYDDGGDDGYDDGDDDGYDDGDDDGYDDGDDDGYDDGDDGNNGSSTWPPNIGDWFNQGDIIYYDGEYWEVRQGFQWNGDPSWNPREAPALFRPLNSPGWGQLTPGDVIQYNGSYWRVVIGFNSSEPPYWTPSTAPGLFEPVASNAQIEETSPIIWSALRAGDVIFYEGHYWEVLIDFNGAENPFWTPTHAHGLFRRL